MVIRVIITGGTIDKYYDPVKQEFRLKRTHIKRMLKEGKDLATVLIDVLMLKDSLYMADDDRELILRECKISKEKQIIITHGTDNMDTTAKLLGKNIKNKTIVITGALRPGTLAKTDALFNLGSAIIAVQTLPKSVYIVISGKIFKWNNVKKDNKKAVFDTIR